jgi:protein-disulfide isomerase
VTVVASQPVPQLSAREQSEFERWWELQPTVANFPYDNEGAKVLVVEFADFQCPQCRVQYLALKPVFDEFAERAGKDVKVMLKQYPLNSDCNPYVPSRMHNAACDAAAAALMARSKGQFEKMVDQLFVHQDELSPAKIRSWTSDIAKIDDFDAQKTKVLQEVKTDASIGSSLSVNSTPTFFINGKRIPGGGLPPQYFKEAIELELKKAK